ncbi:MAG: aminoglycoside phosphotransferase family protein [Candidatus Heimdallarchaeota archaeon]|nr:aminoglycoside phosphotransferase family protein [Candidatus Heimdallarchaeota archaeon]
MLESSLGKLKEILPSIFQVEKITNFTCLANTSVNDLFSFKVKEKEFVVRILTRQPIIENEYYRFEKEARLMQLFTQLNKNISVKKENQVLVPVPKLIHMESNDEIIGYKFLIMEKVNGKSLEEIWIKLSNEDKERLVSKIALITRDIHSIDYEMFGEIEDYDCPRRYFSINSMLKANVRRSVLKLGKEKILPIKLITEVQKFIEKNLMKANFSSIPKLVHNDLNLSNILVATDDDLSIKAILDFEWSYAGDPIVDIWELEKHLIQDEALRELFYEKYSGKKEHDFQKYSLEKSIHKAISALDTIAFGWVHFHPSEENVNYIKKVLEEITISE